MNKQHIEELEAILIENTPMLDSLIDQQHVTPETDIDEISRLWPADDDPDLLLEYVLRERRGRLKLEGEEIG